MSTSRLLCIGEILFDCLADQPGKELAEVESWTAYPGGAPANVACAATKLGTPAAFLGCVGRDRQGDELVQLLSAIGTNTEGIQYRASAPTRQVYVLRTEDGDRSFAGFGDRAPDEFADAYLDASKLPVELFSPADFLVLGTLELAYPQSREAIFRALELARSHHLLVILDVNLRPMFWREPEAAFPLIERLWPLVDLVKLSTEEAELLFKTKDARAITRKLDAVKGVIITGGGEENISYCFGDCDGAIAPFSVRAVDTTGAGDAFLAGFVHQLALQGEASLQEPDRVKQMIAYATAVGALTTTKPGAIAAQPTAKEVEEFLQGS